MARTALIVDDSKSACRVLEGLLAKHRIHADSVHSAEAAFEYLKNSRPDVIFLDHNMPGMDGLQAIRIMKSNPATAAIPVLMYTTREGEVYLGQARALGAVDVLTKDRIRDHLEQSLQKLGMLEGGRVRDRGALVTGEELPPRVTAASGDLADWLQQMQSELSRQMYLILTEEQIAQQEQTKRIAALVQKLVTANNDEIVRRMEVLQDLHRAERQIEARKRRWISLAALLVGLTVATALFWQGQRSEQLLRQLEGRLDQLQAATMDLSREEPASVEAAPAAVVEPLPAPVPEVTTPPAPRPSSPFVIADRGGETVGTLLGVDLQNGHYQAATRNGYLFVVDGQGRAGAPLGTRYFAAANCVGEPLVESLPGTLYRDGEGRLWFTALEETAQELRPLSMQEPGKECQPVDSVSRTLRALLPNDPVTTALSSEEEPLQMVTLQESGSSGR